MGLTFLSPVLLAGIALVAAPIVLHLVMRQSPKHLIFPALRFLQLREQSNRRQLKLRHLLLLLLRCAAIVLLAAALARPSIKAQGMLGSQEAPVAAAVLFDTSPRMEYREANHSRLEVAQDTANWLLTQLPPESEVAVLTSEEESSDFSVDLGAAEQRIAKLKIGGSSTPLAQAIGRAVPLLNAKDKQRKEIYIFTDLASGAWPKDKGQLKSLVDAAGDIGLYVIDVGVAEPKDFSLGDVRVWPEVVAKGGAVQIETTAGRLGPEEDRAVALYVIAPENAGQGADAPRSPTTTGPRMRGQKMVHWKPGEAPTVEFTLTADGPGTYQGYVKILGEDNLAADDIRYFTYDVRPPFRVLLAAPPPVDRRTLLLSEALSPFQFRKTGRSRFDCETTPLDGVADRNLETYSAVCLIDPSPLDDATWNRLKSYVEQGGALAIFLGRNAQPAETFSTAAAAALLPGPLSIINRTDKPARFVAPAESDYQHPLMARFRGIKRSTPWPSFPVWRSWQFASLDKSANVALHFNDGQPAIVDRTVGKGRVLTMTTPISDPAADPDSWNQLATGIKPWPFVILSNEMLLYLVGSGEERLDYLVGDRATLRLGENPTLTKLLLKNSQNPRDATDLTFDSTKGSTLSIPGTTVAANYQVEAGGSADGVRRGFSANIPASSTDLTRIGSETLTDLLGAGRFKLAHNREEIDRTVSVGRVGRELYPILIFLVALAVGGEQLLSNRFYRRGKMAAGPRLSADALTTNSAPPPTQAKTLPAAPPVIPPPLPSETISAMGVVADPFAPASSAAP